MGATSVTGKGLGDSNKMNQLEMIQAIQSIQKTLDNMVKIIHIDSGEIDESNHHIFGLPSPTPLDADAYAIFVTSEDGVPLTWSLSDNDDGKLTAVEVSCEETTTATIMIVEKNSLLG